MRFGHFVLTALCATSLGSLAFAQATDGALALKFNYTTFPVSVSNAVAVGVEAINDSGAISGYYTDTAGDTLGFLLPQSNGTIQILSNPANTSTPSYTLANQISANGTVFGEYYDTASNTYSGFTYLNGAYTPYNVPNEPQYTTTGLYGGTDTGNLCGFFWPPPYTNLSAFVVRRGTLNAYSIGSSTTSYCVSMSAFGTAGIYVDSNGVNHGWTMNLAGKVTTIDYPGAATTLGATPCAGNAGGTIVLGINDLGDVSGHFWDSSYYEHGFLMTAAGKFYQLDVPGAFQTSGGGVNNKRQVVGHYAPDNTCGSAGYIAAGK